METREPQTGELSASPGIAAPRPFPTANLALFAVTIASTLWAGATFSVEGGWAPAPLTTGEWLLVGLPFTCSLLGILVAHEMGHFVTARMHRVDASWPYFIPVPFGVGTMGAVIKMRGRIPSRNALVDIGASGPLAGAVVAIPLLVYGVSLSRIEPIATQPNLLFGNLSLIRLAQALINWTPPWSLGLSMEPQPLLYLLLKKWVFAVGPGQDVIVHPIAFAAVIGLYVTALNLVPIGQLDGGHVAHAVLGRRAERFGRAFGWVLLGMAVCSSATWIVWWLVVRRFVGYRHPPVEEAGPLSPGRRAIVIATVLLFLLTLTPVSADML